jgi:N-acetylmuramoyl-L-alanine amidase
MILRPSPNFEPRPEGTVIDMLVLHYTGMASGPAALERLCDPEAKVSAHYLIEEDGTVYSLVPEEMRAWHAGVSSWRGRSDINSRSIGIELVNPGHEFGYRPFPKAQMDALIGLAQSILSAHPIPARNVVAHSDVAPARKDDPGELFDWKELAAEGIGLWPQPAEVGSPLPGLADYGYDLADEKAAVIAFQRHFRQDNLSGEFDEECQRLLLSLLRRVE